MAWGYDSYLSPDFNIEDTLIGDYVEEDAFGSEEPDPPLASDLILAAEG